MATTVSLYRHGLEKVGDVEIPEEFPNLPDVLLVDGEYYRNVSEWEPAHHAVYWLATFKVVSPGST